MDSIDIPADRVPDGLKPCEQILKRAKEVKKVEPVVAYWCCFYAAQKALKVPERTKNDTLFLMSLLDALEQMKATMADNDAIHNEAAGAAYIQNFALKVFMSADNDDRNGVTGKATIRKFVVSGQFIEVLSCFENGMTEEMSQKLQYARWKAADGAKALREGRTPSSGPPVPEPELALPSLPTSPPSGASQLPTTASSHSSPAFDPTSRPSPRPSPSPLGGNNKASLPNIDTSLSLPSSVIAHTALTQADLASANLSEGFTEGRTPQRSASTASGAWSTVATPGLPDDEAEERRFPGVPTGSGGGKEEGSGICAQAPGTPTAKADTALPPPTSTPRSPGDSKKNVRFMGPDGAPLSPAHTHFTVDSYDSPAAPPPTEYSYAQDQVDGTGRTQGQGQGGDVPGSAVLGSKGLASQPTSAATAKHGQGQGSVPMQSGGSGSGSGSGGNGSGSGSSRNARPRGDSDATRTSDNSTSLRNTGVLGVNGTSRPAPPYTPSPSAPSAPPSANIARNGTTPSAPPLHTVSFSQASTSTPHAPAPSTPAPAPAAAATPKPTRKTVEQCQKHARWAVSALEFDDPETARSELRKALALLEG